MSQHPTTKLARLDTVIANRLKAHAKERNPSAPFSSSWIAI